MNKFFSFLFIFTCSFIFSQTTIFGNVPGLAFRKHNVKTIILPPDTLEGRLMNFHLVHDTVSGSFFKKLNTGLNQPTLFIVSNKFGGTGKKVYGKIGSSIISSLGVNDFGDSLRINSPTANAKIMTFTKSDINRKISPIVFLNKKTDKKLLIPEILVFDHILSPIDQQKIETYLSIKYGITINDISEKNYISSVNNIIWNSKKNKNYNFRITGLGRDDAFGLYQKQSKNADDSHIVMALDSLKLTNIYNTGTLENKSFLLWGDNNQELKFKEVDLLSQHPKRDMVRMWKVQKKTPGNLPMSSSLYLTLAGLTQNDHVKLRVFSNESNYQNDSSIDFTGSKLNDSLYVFKNIAWDPDGDGIDYFTFNLQNPESEVNVQLTSTCNDLGNNLIKISVPTNISPFEYSLISMTTNQMVINPISGATNPIIFNNLTPDYYKLLIHRQGYPDIIRTFDLEGIVNQNIDANYLWEGSPIELDLNTDSYQYTLISPTGQHTTTAPYLLNGLGNYQLTIKNKLGCEITKSLSVLSQVDYGALQSNSLFKKITVSPNPSHDGNLTIKVELKTARPLTVKIFNSLGVLIKQGQYNSATDFTIPMNIPPVVGYYNIKIFIPEEGKGVNFIIN